MRTYKDIIDELTAKFGEIDELNQTLTFRLNNSIEVFKQLKAEIASLKKQREENIQMLMELKTENTKLKQQLNERNNSVQK